MHNKVWKCNVIKRVCNTSFYLSNKSRKKIQYIYKLTPSGISEKTKLTISFMKRKMAEYDELKKELEETKKN